MRRTRVPTINESADNEIEEIRSERDRLRQGIEALAGGYEGAAEHRCGCCDPDQTMPWCDCDNAEDSVSEGRDQQRLECASALRALLRSDPKTDDGGEETIGGELKLFTNFGEW